MTYFHLRKPAEKPEPDPVDEDVEEAEPDEPEEAEGDQPQKPEPQGHPVLGLVPALCQGGCRWCAWCADRIGAIPTVGVHGMALYAATHYSEGVTLGVVGAFGLVVVAFTPKKAWEAAAASLDAQDKARETRRQARQTSPDKPVGEGSADPLPVLLDRLIGEAPGVHLKTLVEALGEAAQKAGQRAPKPAEVEAALAARGIPVRPSVRDARGRLAKVNRGVHREDLEAWARGPSPTETDGVARGA